jgi:hypothetical protein
LDEHLLNVLRMAEEHRAFRTEPEGDHVPILALETAQKAQHITVEGKEMGPGNACPWAGWRGGGDHKPSFCAGTARLEGVG